MIDSTMLPNGILFLADGTLDRPLLHSQGIPLLRRLAASGIGIFFRKGRPFTDTGAAAESELSLDRAVDACVATYRLALHHEG